jgi:hypothetical protein
MRKAVFPMGTIGARFALDELPGILGDVAGFRAGLEADAAE